MNTSFLTKSLLAAAVVTSCGFALYATQHKAAEILSKEICVGDKQTGASDGYGGHTENNVGPIAGYYSAFFSQSLYLADQLGITDAATVNLTKLTYQVTKDYEAKSFPFQVYVGMTSNDEIATWSCIPLADQTLVFDGNLNLPMGDSTLEIPFAEAFAYDTTKHLVVTFVKKNTQNTYMINWKWFDTAHKQFVQGSDTSGLYGEDSYKSAPVVTLSYTTGASSDIKITDLAAANLKVPASFEENTPATVKVEVANRGTETLANYTVELVDATEGENVLATTVVDEPLEGNATKSVPLTVTFPNRGNRTIFARVAVADDSNLDNNATAPITVEVAMKKPADVRTQNLNTWNTWTETINGVEVVQGMNTNAFLPGNGMGNSAGAQFIYPAAKLDMPRSAQLYSLSFYMKKYEYNSPTVHFKVYLGTTDQTSYPNKTILKNQTLVYEGDKNFYQPAEGEEWKINFTQPFAYDNTKNLVVTIVSTMDGNSVMPYVHCNSTDTDVMLDRQGNDLDFFNITNAYYDKKEPIASVEYTLDPLPEITDVAPGALTVATPLDEVTHKATFATTVSNLGTVDVEGFTVEIVDITDGVETVLGSRTYDRTLAAESSFNAKVPVEFVRGGMHHLAARVSVEGDANVDNNTSEILDFDVNITINGVNSAVLSAVRYEGGRLLLGDNVSNVKVYDAAGRLMLNSAAVAEMPLRLATGVYTVVVKTADCSTAVLKIRK